MQLKLAWRHPRRFQVSHARVGGYFIAKTQHAVSVWLWALNEQLMYLMDLPPYA